MINKTIENKVGKYFLENNKTISVAESCTGGLLSSLLTDVSGSSLYIKSNFVTYANEAKTKYLGVNPKTLNEFGAVSEETALEMAKGLLKETKTDFAIATTGIAGPTGGTKAKPVGLIYIAIANQEKTQVFKYNAPRYLPRRLMKFLFAKQALKYLYKFLKG